jgi:hypothetical protein
MPPVYIYALADPDSGEIRYIGQSKNVWKRYASHLMMLQGSAAKHIWFQELQQRWKMPVLKILEDGLSPEEANERERQWIAYYALEGSRMVNILLIPKVRENKLVVPKPRQRKAFEARSRARSHPLFLWRRKYEVSQGELAELTGITQPYISLIERYRNAPMGEALERLRWTTGLATDAFVRPRAFLIEQPYFLGEGYY